MRQQGANKIRKKELLAYLNFLGGKLRREVVDKKDLPAWLVLDEHKISAALSKLYLKLSIYRNEGYQYERVFHEQYISPYIGFQDATVGALDVPGSARKYRRPYKWLNRSTYKSYLHWIGEQTNKRIDRTIFQQWSNLPDKELRTACVSLYSSLGINRENAFALEDSYCNRYLRYL